MSLLMQATLAQEVRAVGVGLHSGRLIEMVLKPAAPNTGIIFTRTDLGGASVKAGLESIDFEALQLATSLRANDVSVQTTEHLLSALHGMGVDNVMIVLDGPEVPIMDGSAAPFLVLLEEAGVKHQPVPKKIMEIIKPFSFEFQGKSISVEPAPDFRISYEIDFDHPLIRKQTKTIVLDEADYAASIAPARTFGFLKDINYLKSKGLARGGSLENAVVLDGDRFLNESLRSHDEFVCHKILDMIGDFAVAGVRFRGHFTAVKAGHEVHARFLRALFQTREAYRFVRGAMPGLENAAAAQALPKPLTGIA